MWVQATQKSNYRALPIEEIRKNSVLKTEISTYDYTRAKEVFELITEVMLGEKLTIDQSRERLYFTLEGYKREKAKPIEQNENSEIVKLINNANSICFIGDSITEGTKNGGYGWYEPLVSGLENKEILNVSKGGATTKTILDLYQNSMKVADLYVIAIGTNDIRYRNKNICCMDEEEYILCIQEIMNSIPNRENAKFVFISPWNSLENDTNSNVNHTEKQELMNHYSVKLEEYCQANGYLFVNPNPIVFETLEKESYEKYMVDYIHPNSEAGIELYSRAVQEASVK